MFRGPNGFSVHKAGGTVIADPEKYVDNHFKNSDQMDILIDMGCDNFEVTALRDMNGQYSDHETTHNPSEVRREIKFQEKSCTNRRSSTPGIV